MGINAKRLIFMILIIMGCVWNMFCLLSIVPIENYVLSLAVVGIISLIDVFRNLFVPYTKEEKSVYIKDLSSFEKAYAGFTALLIISWIISVIACIVK